MKALLVFVLLGCPFLRGQQLTWIVTGSALKMMQNIDADLADHFFNNSSTYVSGSVPAGWTSIPYAGFKSLADFQNALANKTIGPAIKAVSYDNEDWPLTPDSEKTSAAASTARFAKLAHANGYIFISTPGTDLVRAQPAYDKSKRLQENYLAMGFPAFSAGAPADIYEIQSQSQEPDTSRYVWYVTSAAARARQANPKVVVLAGLSTAPAGKTVTVDQIYQAIVQTRAIVSGYWLNIPGPGRACPTCVPPDPHKAVDVLRKLRSQPR